MYENATDPTHGRIIIATLPNGSFGSAGQSWKTLNVEVISEIFKQSGHDSLVIPVDELLVANLDPEDIVIYTSSEIPAIRKYIKDVMYFVDKKCHIVPRYELLLAHENKGFQELAKEENGFGNLKGTYHYDLNNVTQDYPYVFKTLTGAGSSGVELVRSENEKESLWHRLFRPSLKRRVIMRQRKYKLLPCEYEIYRYRHSGYMPFVKQTFVDGLKHDFKILVFGDEYYTMMRRIRQNDFRASGSGNFEFDAKLPPEVLDFSRNIFRTLDTPCASLDVALSNEGCHLLEYQALNFGPIALNRSSLHYEHKDGRWTQIRNTLDLNHAYAHSFLRFINQSGM